jgi:NifU-like protein involved in Fe-S cluster formation
MQDLYTENILEKARDKSFDILDIDRDENKLTNYICGQGKNPSCGDIGNMYFLLGEDRNEHGEMSSIIKDIKLEKEGCAISEAGLVMLTQKIIGMQVNSLKKIVPGDIYNMLGVHISPSRAGCAMLCYNALEDFLKKIDN